MFEFLLFGCFVDSRCSEFGRVLLAILDRFYESQSYMTWSINIGPMNLICLDGF